MKAVVFLSSARTGSSITGEGSIGDPIGQYIANQLKEEGHEVSVWDPKVMKFPMLEQPLYMVEDQSQFPEWMLEANTELKAADCFVVICSEYNASIPPALTNMLDYFSPGVYRHKPVGIVTYSVTETGGRRVQSPLKTLLSELGMIVQPTVVSASKAKDIFNKEGECMSEHISSKIKSLVKETVWYSEALTKQRAVREAPTASRF